MVNKNNHIKNEITIIAPIINKRIPIFLFLIKRPIKMRMKASKTTKM